MENCQLPVTGEHELLESTIQHLYGLGLKLEACLQETSSGGHRDTIDGAINTIGDLIDSLRARIELLEGHR